MSEIQVEPEKIVDAQPAVEPEPKEPAAKEPEQEDKKEPEAKEPEKPDQKELDKRAERKAQNQQKAWERLIEEKATLKARVELYEQQMAAQQQQQRPSGRPERDKFQSDEDYVSALTDWTVEQKMAPIQEERERDHASRVQEQWEEKITKASQTYPDYDDVLADSQDVRVSKAVAGVLMTSEIGGDVAYYLAKHQEEMDRLNVMDPVSIGRAIGRIEEKIERERAAKPKAKVSQAPEPIKSPTSSSSASIKNLEDMSMAEYVAYMDKQEAAKRKRF